MLPMTDGRSATARRFKDLVGDIAADLGGMAEVSTAEMQMIRRAALLSAECEKQEALAVQEDVEFDCDTYIVKTNALRRVFETIGLKRVPRDVSPTLDSYLKAKAEPPVEAFVIKNEAAVEADEDEPTEQRKVPQWIDEMWPGK